TCHNKRQRTAAITLCVPFLAVVLRRGSVRGSPDHQRAPVSDPGWTLEDTPMLDRREFCQRGAVAAALFGLPLARAEEVFGPEAPRLPAGTLYATDPDRYWAELRRQWLLAADRINLNCGSVGCTPLPVLRAMIDHLLSAEAFREPGYPWFGYEENRHLRDLRDALAAFLHCRRDELALVRNATEGNNVVCN